MKRTINKSKTHETCEFLVYWNDFDSIKKGENQKIRLENSGYQLHGVANNPINNTSRYTYQKKLKN
jgi:hypothetical protein